MLRKSRTIQSIAVNTNDFKNITLPAKKLGNGRLERVKYLGSGLKEIIYFIALSMALLVGISLLPKS